MLLAERAGDAGALAVISCPWLRPRCLTRCASRAALPHHPAFSQPADALCHGADALRDPRALLGAAQACTREPGASTAVVLVLDGAARTLHAVNLGDSGFRLLRAGALAFASATQQHEFDCPYQLGYSKFIADNDTAAMGDQMVVPLQEGDLLILASDGLFDNMYEGELVRLAAAALAEAPPGADGAGAHAAAQRVAAALAAAAAAAARDRAFDSPYAREAAKDAAAKKAAAGPFGMLSAAFGKSPAVEQPATGGKLDDVTVVAAVVLAVSAAGAAAELAAAAAAAEASRAAVPSAVADAEAEARDVLIGTTEADDAAAAAAVVEAAAAERRAAFLPAFDPATVAAMEAPALRKALAALGLPTSGKLEVLRARLADVQA